MHVYKALKKVRENTSLLAIPEGYTGRYFIGFNHGILVIYEFTDQLDCREAEDGFEILDENQAELARFLTDTNYFFGHWQVFYFEAAKDYYMSVNNLWQ